MRPDPNDDDVTIDGGDDDALDLGNGGNASIPRHPYDDPPAPPAMEPLRFRSPAPVARTPYPDGDNALIRGADPAAVMAMVDRIRSAAPWERYGPWKRVATPDDLTVSDQFRGLRALVAAELRKGA